MQTTNPNFYSMTVKMQRFRVKIGICGLYYHPSNPFLFCGFFSDPYSPFKIFQFFITLIIATCMFGVQIKTKFVHNIYVCDRICKKGSSTHILSYGGRTYIYGLWRKSYEADILLTTLLFSSHPFSIWIVRVGKKICVEDHDYYNDFIGKM